MLGGQLEYYKLTCEKVNMSFDAFVFKGLKWTIRHKAMCVIEGKDRRKVISAFC